jgi:hypothetical protein
MKKMPKNEFDSFKKDMNNFFKSVESVKEMRLIGNDAVDIIKERTRGDYQGVHNPGGRRAGLRRVSDGYAAWRDKHKTKHPEAASGVRCNLTLTGAMLDKLRLLKANEGFIMIGWRDNLNQAKAAMHHATGRAFLFLASAEIKQIVNSYSKRIASLAKKV